MRRSRTFSVLALCLFAASCEPSTPPADPALRGTITSRAAFHVAGDSVPAMFVDGVGIWPADEPCLAKAQFVIDARTTVMKQGARSDTAALVVGRLVTVWATGAVLQSCPPIMTAAKVVVED